MNSKFLCRLAIVPDNCRKSKIKRVYYSTLLYGKQVLVTVLICFRLDFFQEEWSYAKTLVFLHTTTLLGRSLI